MIQVNGDGVQCYTEARNAYSHSDPFHPVRRDVGCNSVRDCDRQNASHGRRLIPDGHPADCHLVQRSASLFQFFFFFFFFEFYNIKEPARNMIGSDKISMCVETPSLFLLPSIFSPARICPQEQFYSHFCVCRVPRLVCLLALPAPSVVWP